MNEDTPLDPAASVALIAEQRSKVKAAIDVNERLIFGVWGIAWLVGFGLLWVVSIDDPLLRWSEGVALSVFGALLVAAMVVTTVHTARRSSGVRGPSSTVGAMYGWSWFAAFAGVSALGYALSILQVAPKVSGTVMTIVPALVVGALYMAGGAVWQDRTQFSLGVVISVSTVAAAVVGYPHMLLVMSLAGGGGMLTCGAVSAVRRGARR
jgi:hypothetical protein